MLALARAAFIVPESSMRHFLLRLFQLICVLVIAALLWGGWYLSQRGFTRKWRQYVTQELQNRGLDISISRLTMDPFRGLVARTVRIEDASREHRLLATLDEVVLDINVANLLQKQPFIEAMELRDAEVSLPVGGDGAGRSTLQISQLNARVLLPPHQIYVSRASARILGIDCQVSGRVTNPEAWTSGPSAGSQKTEPGQDFVSQIQRAMKEIAWQGREPRLELRFTGDGAQPQDLSAALTFRAEAVGWRGCAWKDVSVQASYARQELELKEFSAKDEVGQLNLAGTLDSKSGQVDGQARCSLDVAKIAAALGFSESLKDCRFSGPPELEISAHGSLKTSDFRLIGRINVPPFGIKKVDFQEISGQFSWDGTRWYLRDVLLRNESGQLALNAMSVPGNFQARLESTLNPNALQPLLSGPAAAFLHEWNFLQAPEIRLTAHGPAPAVAVCQMEGSVKLGHTRFRGAGIQSLTADLHAANGTATIDHLNLVREEGAATGSFNYDFAKNELRLQDVKTNLFPSETIVWVDPRMLPNVTPYRFQTPPTLTINGLAQIGQDTRTRLEILVSAPKGMDYTFLGKELPLTAVSGRLFFTHGNLNLSEVSARLFDGQLAGNADISIDRNRPGYRAHIETHAIDFSTLTKLYFNYGSSSGKLDGIYDFSGKNNDVKTMAGRGSLKVTNGNVFAIPIFGPLSGLMNGVLPGLGYNIAREATATFSIANGVITTNDFLVHGKGFDMVGNGLLDFVGDKIDFNIRINAQGFTGRLLMPISKLFEYEGQGKLSRPVWKPKRLPAL